MSLAISSLPNDQAFWCVGPKIFAHTGKDGTVYTIRILPLGGYVRMAGWGEDTTEIKTGSPASLTLGKDGKVRRINLSDRQVDQTALPMNVTAYDLEDKLTITGLVLGETKTYEVDHDATIVEEDGTELRIAPKDVQYGLYYPCLCSRWCSRYVDQPYPGG